MLQRKKKIYHMPLIQYNTQKQMEHMVSSLPDTQIKQNEYTRSTLHCFICLFLTYARALQEDNFFDVYIKLTKYALQNSINYIVQVSIIFEF